MPQYSPGTGEQFLSCLAPDRFEDREVGRHSSRNEVIPTAFHVGIGCIEIEGVGGSELCPGYHGIRNGNGAWTGFTGGFPGLVGDTLQVLAPGRYCRVESDRFGIPGEGQKTKVLSIIAPAGTVLIKMQPVAALSAPGAESDEGSAYIDGFRLVRIGGCFVFRRVGVFCRRIADSRHRGVRRTILIRTR